MIWSKAGWSAEVSSSAVAAAPAAPAVGGDASLNAALPAHQPPPAPLLAACLAGAPRKVDVELALLMLHLKAPQAA